jgi:hypothetical protein
MVIDRKSPSTAGNYIIIECIQHVDDGEILIVMIRGSIIRIYWLSLYQLQVLSSSSLVKQFGIQFHML